MANHRNAKTKPNQSAARATKVNQSVASVAPSPLAWTFGIVCLLVSVGASAMLVYQHLTGLAIPGCGVGSPCHELANSVWGKVPGTGLPVSSLGLAYFTAALMGWLVSRGGVAGGFKWIVRLGVAASVMFLIVMAVKNQPCRYCLAAHAGNLLFWLVVEISGRPSIGAMRPVVAAATAFVAAILVLVGLEWRQSLEVARSEQQAFEESTAKMARGSSAGGSTSIVNPTPTTDVNSAATAPQTLGQQGFTGRYREGPEDAAMRVVIFSDYQCSDCRSLEMQAKAALAKHKNMSLSAKQYPLNSDCNPTLTSTMHPNACWAARAAEAAGILRGNDGFWVMHHWLFERGGAFTDQELNAKLLELGYDISEFTQTMSSPEVARRLKADAEEAQSYGIMYTPMVFINGVELRGYRAPQALTRAMDMLADTKPKPGSSLDDHPPVALQKYIDDWRFQMRAPLPQAVRFWPSNATDPQNARVRIDVFGDYQDAYTCELDPAVRSLREAFPEVTYVYHSFPFDQACNSNVPRTGNPLGCRAARAAEAAGVLGGDDAYWKMHAWLMDNREKFSDETLKQAAPAMGLDPDALLTTMDEAVVAAALARDAADAKSLNITQLPMLFINGRFVPRWKQESDSVLPQIVQEAMKQGP